MLRILNKTAASAKLLSTPKLTAVRCMSGIPTDAEQQAGRRKAELDAAKNNEILFNRDPIIPKHDAGTRENPILVPSGNHSRTVGFEDPQTHQIYWFNLDQGPLHFVPLIGLYFKLDTAAH